LDAIKAASEKAASLLAEVIGLVNSINGKAANSSQVFENASSGIDSGLQEQVECNNL
jgi:hypothetical protein